MNRISASQSRWAMTATRTIMAVFLLAATMSGAGNPAAASQEVRQQATVTLYTGSPSDPIIRFGYDDCASTDERPVPTVVVRFDNRPVSGCQALLVNRAGASYLLCNGTGDIPNSFQNTPRLRTQSGLTPPC